MLIFLDVTQFVVFLGMMGRIRLPIIPREKFNCGIPKFFETILWKSGGQPAG